MARVRRSGTRPELTLQAALKDTGIGFRRNVRKLPGSPDLVSRRIALVVFVHGCFWHRHPRCRATTTPSRNRAFWLAKFAANVKRDRSKAAALRSLGYRVITVWECRLKTAEGVAKQRRRILRVAAQARRTAVQRSE